MTSDLDLSVSSSVDNVLCGCSSAGRGNILAAETRQDAGISAGQSARGAVRVDFAVVAKVLLALRVGRRARAGENLSTESGLHGLLDVLEDIALSNDLSTRVGLEGVVGVAVEVVVDSMEESVASNLGRTARGVVDVVALEGDEIVGAGEIHSPVVVSVACCRPGGGAVDFAVGDGDAAGGAVSEDDMLAGNQVGCNVVDPDKVT